MSKINGRYSGVMDFQAVELDTRTRSMSVLKRVSAPQILGTKF